MKKEKLGFFKKLYLVITDFRTYPFLVKHERFLKSILYLLTLTLIISLILSANIFMKLDYTMKTIIAKYNVAIPEFSLSGGVLNVETKYNEKLDNNSYFVLNTDYTYDEYSKTKEYGALVIYDNLIVINNDKIIIETPASVLGVPFKELNYETNKDRLYNEITRIYESTEYIPYLISLYFSIFIGYFCAVLIKVLFLAFVISFISFFTGIRLNFKNYIKIAIYAYSLPLIIELISFCFGVSGKDYVYYTTLLLTYIYIIYAIRAVRLDAFIMMFSKKDNLKHTSSEFENELKKYNEIVNNKVEDDKREDNEDKK